MLAPLPEPCAQTGGERSGPGTGESRERSVQHPASSAPVPQETPGVV